MSSKYQEKCSAGEVLLWLWNSLLGEMMKSPVFGTSLTLSTGEHCMRDWVLPQWSTGKWESSQSPVPTPNHWTPVSKDITASFWGSHHALHRSRNRGVNHSLYLVPLGFVSLRMLLWGLSIYNHLWHGVLTSRFKQCCATALYKQADTQRLFLYA